MVECVGLSDLRPSLWACGYHQAMTEQQHVVIRHESYVAGTRDRPEVGIFTQAHAPRPPVPWGKLSLGELVWMEWSGGPIVALARVQRFVELEDCTPEQLRHQTFGH